jgi:hypothetical protein
MEFSVAHGFLENGPSKSKPKLPRLLQFVLPPFQRGEVWTTTQKSRFIESLWLGLPISVYAYNESPTFGEIDYWLIDGQQRWTAIRDFVENKFEVFGGLKYSDMNECELRQFKNKRFPAILINSDDVKELQDIYERLAYGGTAHEKSGESK